VKFWWNAIWNSWNWENLQPVLKGIFVIMAVSIIPTPVIIFLEVFANLDIIGHLPAALVAAGTGFLTFCLRVCYFVATSSLELQAECSRLRGSASRRLRDEALKQVSNIYARDLLLLGQFDAKFQKHCGGNLRGYLGSGFADKVRMAERYVERMNNQYATKLNPHEMWKIENLGGISEYNIRDTLYQDLFDKILKGLNQQTPDE